MGKVYLICKSYFYESESYWDKEKKQPRSKRTLIGKLDEETGEIIPTGKSGRRKAGSENQPTDGAVKKPITDQVNLLPRRTNRSASSRPRTRH